MQLCLIVSPSAIAASERRFFSPQIRIFPRVLSETCPIVSPPFFSQSLAMKTAPGAHLSLAERLILLRELDPLRKWESLEDQRFCRCCHKFISGRQIEVRPTAGKTLRLVCPTSDCSATVRDWVYPNEIGQPREASGSRVLRVIDKSGESFIACEKPYSRRRASQRFGPGSRTAA